MSHSLAAAISLLRKRPHQPPQPARRTSPSTRSHASSDSVKQQRLRSGRTTRHKIRESRWSDVHDLPPRRGRPFPVECSSPPRVPKQPHTTRTSATPPRAALEGMDRPQFQGGCEVAPPGQQPAVWHLLTFSARIVPALRLFRRPPAFRRRRQRGGLGERRASQLRGARSTDLSCCRGLSWGGAGIVAGRCEVMRLGFGCVSAGTDEISSLFRWRFSFFLSSPWVLSFDSADVVCMGKGS